MGTPEEIQPASEGRGDSVREEYEFCRRALESGAYDSLSDKAWVALCEQVAADSRHGAAEDGGGTGKSGGHTSPPPK